MNAVEGSVAAVKKADKYLEKLFRKFQHLSEENRELIAKSWPAISLVFGAIQLYWAWILWRFTRFSVPNSELFNRIYVSYPDALSGGEKFVFYMGIFVLLLEAVILFMAYAPLKRRERRGWDLLLLAMLVNAINAFVSLFISERGSASFVFGLLSSFIGFYLLYEVRGKYGKVKTAKK